MYIRTTGTWAACNLCINCIYKLVNEIEKNKNGKNPSGYTVLVRGPCCYFFHFYFLFKTLCRTLILWTFFLYTTLLAINQLCLVENFLPLHFLWNREEVVPCTTLNVPTRVINYITCRSDIVHAYTYLTDNRLYFFLIT